jgi:DNA invertase Pin-like site-specific DNA recombinase
MPRRADHPAKGEAASYGRLSMMPRYRQTFSPGNQDRLNKESAVLHGLQIKPGYEFWDTESASKHRQRKDLDRAVAAIMNREVEALIVPKLDRLSREGMGRIGLLLDDFEQVGARVIFADDGLDSSQEGARAIIAFKAEQARTEARNMAWRMEQYREGARLSGRWLSPRPFGYIIEDGKLKPYPLEAPVVRRILDEFLKGGSYRSIAYGLNADGIPAPSTPRPAGWQERARDRGRAQEKGTWGFGTIQRIVNTPVLCGWHTHEGRVVRDADGEPISFGEGIIEPAEYVRIQAEVARRTTVVRRSKDPYRIGGKTGGGRPTKYLLTGFAKCATCGYSCTAMPYGKRWTYYCVHRMHGHPCPVPGRVFVEEADAEAVRQLTFRLSAMEPDDPILQAVADRWLKLQMPAQEGDRALLTAKQEAIRARIASLDEARYGRDEFPEPEDIERWQRLRRNLMEQRKAVQAALDELGPPPSFDLGELLDTFRSRQSWEEMPLTQRRVLLSIAVEKVLLGSMKGDQVPIEDLVTVVLVGEESDAATPASASPPHDSATAVRRLPAQDG